MAVQAMLARMLADLSPAALKERNKLLAQGSGGSENESVSRTGSSSSLASLPRRLHGTCCTGHVVPGARRCALGTFSYLVTSRS